MNRIQYKAMLKAFEQDKNSLAKYQKKYQYAYILSDGIFKIVFASDEKHELLISLVNAMLNLHGKAAIKSITLEMQEYPGVLNKKTCILDIIGTTNASKKILVEIQQNGDSLFRDRVEYYMSRIIENQVHKSQKYKLPRIYFLGLLDFRLFREAPCEYIHHVEETCRGKPFFPKIQKIFVEVEKFFELENQGIVKDDDSDAAQWLRAIKSLMDEKPMPEKLLQNPIFLKLQKEMKLCNFSDDVFNVEVHNMTDLKYEHECGYIEGHKKGRKEGRAQGRAQGREEGFNDAKKKYEARIKKLEEILAKKVCKR